MLKPPTPRTSPTVKSAPAHRALLMGKRNCLLFWRNLVMVLGSRVSQACADQLLRQKCSSVPSLHKVFFRGTPIYSQLVHVPKTEVCCIAPIGAHFSLIAAKCVKLPPITLLKKNLCALPSCVDTVLAAAMVQSCQDIKFFHILFAQCAFYLLNAILIMAAEATIPVSAVATTPFSDQKPGTSGLRKKTSVFEGQQHYLENFIQATFNALESEGAPVKGQTIVAASDGRSVIAPCASFHKCSKHSPSCVPQVLLQACITNHCSNGCSKWCECFVDPT